MNNEKHRNQTQKNTQTQASVTQTTDNSNYSVRASKPQLSKYALTIMHYSAKTWKANVVQHLCNTIIPVVPKKQLHAFNVT